MSEHFELTKEKHEIKKEIYQANPQIVSGMYVLCAVWGGFFNFLLLFLIIIKIIRCVFLFLQRVSTTLMIAAKKKLRNKNHEK